MNQNGYIGRKMRLPALKEKPAVVIAAFGSSNRAKMALNLFEKKLEEHFPGTTIYWAYTSEIIRKKLGLPSLQKTLANVETDGYRKAVVQPLHIFPGTEYQQLAEICGFYPGMRVFLGETLLHRWDFIKRIIRVVASEFLSPEEGLNLLAIHGTPLAADQANIIYLGFERLMSDMYPNVLTASVEGIPDHEALFAKMERENLRSRYKRIKIIPLMYFAGLHAEEDLMGNTGSWRRALESQGFAVDCPITEINGKKLFKGLAYYPEVNESFINRLKRAMELAKYF